MIPSSYVRRLPFICGIIGLVIVTRGIAQEPGQEELAAAYQKQIMKATDFTKVLAGKWEAVPNLQPSLDNLSERPDANGRFKNFQIEFVDLEEFWKYRQIRESADEMKKTAAQFNHRIIAAGMAGGEAGIDGFSAFFVLTQRDGETFLGVIMFRDVATFEPWRLHYIDGKEPAESLLLIEMGPKGSGQQVVVFKRAPHAQ